MTFHVDSGVFLGARGEVLFRRYFWSGNSPRGLVVGVHGASEHGGQLEFLAPVLAEAGFALAVGPDKQYRVYPELGHNLWRESSRDEVAGDLIAWLRSEPAELA